MPFLSRLCFSSVLFPVLSSDDTQRLFINLSLSEETFLSFKTAIVKSLLQLLLSRLSSIFGLTDLALRILTSYLTGRSQSVSIDSHVTTPSPMQAGVPQGSVLGRLVFCLCTIHLSHLLSATALSNHFYVDDTQL